MTNHWADLSNSTCFIVWGANPAENHPASIAHIGRARFPKDFVNASDPRANKKPAQLIVIDPRKTRTAALCNEGDLSKPSGERDRFIRMRPGTDIALANGLVRYMISKVESLPASDPVRTKFFAYLNQNQAGQFYSDGNATAGSTTAAGNVAAAQGDGFANGNSKYTDARFLVNSAGTDYERRLVRGSTGEILPDGTPTDSTTFANFPIKATTVDASPNTVYNRLKAHVAPYTLAVTADIVGCSELDIAFIGDAFIRNSRCSSGTSNDARDPEYRATAMLYAMGITQHTCGGQNVKAFAVLQTLLGNMGRAGGGINALRGIHNVQGSTDMGLLYGNIPAYSGNPTVQVDAIPSTNNAFGRYMDALWGNPLSGTGNRTQMNGSYDDAYSKTATGLGMTALQQAGFFNMTMRWFGGMASAHAAGTLAAKRTIVDAAYSLWPKGNGDNHIQMFRNMQMDAGASRIKAAVIWGQNPAVTEPNQSEIREGLYDLDLLVCADMFLTETGDVSRKPGGVTFLFPSCSHPEKAGSVTNSGRTLQWRYKLADPRGNSKDDTELLLRFARALDDGGAFSHIKNVWDAYGISYDTSVYKELYQNQYGGFDGVSFTGANAFANVSGTADMVNLRTNVSQPVSYETGVTVTGSEWVAECVYRQMCTASALDGTIWIYTGAYHADFISNRHTNQPEWGSYNRAKCRDRWDGNGQLAFPGWGYSWLVNRRVLYNNNSAVLADHEVPGDVADFFMGPDSCSRLFVSTNTAVLNYARWYRTIHRLADRPDVVLDNVASSPHFVSTGLSYAGRFPAHVEPYETPRADLAARWGRNTKGGAKYDLIPGDSRMAAPGRSHDATQYPLVLTTIRCVEHFQGGPITRNNHWNAEIEPEPWIELSSADARTYGIRDGDMVKIVTARTEHFPDQMMPKYGEGFRARVGVGLQGNQRVGAGVVAIPWHWGEKGLSTGSRANDLCIDSMDANTTIPESKACLCRIEKM